MEDPTSPRFLIRQTVGQSFSQCSHVTYPGLLEDSLGLGLLGRDHGALRTGITTTSKPELQEQGEKSPEMEWVTHCDPRGRWVS